MQDPILVINAGSSSIKFAIFQSVEDGTLSEGAHGVLDGIGTSPRLEVRDATGRPMVGRPVEGRDQYEGAIRVIHDWFVDYVKAKSALYGVGHRVVHGGLAYSGPTLIDHEVLANLEALTPLAPLHQPHHLAAIRAIRTVAPTTPQVACFDTAFHRAQPPLAQEFALPREITEKGVRRYGFHGLSYEYIVSALPRVAPEIAGGKLVVAHLGNGASMCAIDGGRSIATTMGFTPLDGLPMGTRTGSLDPGVILYLLQHEGMDVGTVQHMLYERSGLLGVSGLSSDMRTLLASAERTAKEAVDLFVYRIGRELGSLVAALGGLDAVIFTGGIGEHAAPVRARVCRQAAWLGLVLDEEANLRGDARISRRESRVSAWVVPTDENLMVARHTRDLLDRARRAET